MRKLTALILALLLAFGGAAAMAEDTQEIDLSGMDASQLVALINQARTALAELLPPVVDGTTLYEDENISITLNGEAYIEYGSLVLPIIVVNHTERNLLISLDNVSVNGWDVSGGTASVSAGKKAKEEFDFYDAEEDAELKDVSELTDVTCTISYFDSDDYDWDVEGTVVTWTFK